MTIALMSRGYLCRAGGTIQVGDGPDIIDQRVVAPSIDGSGITGVEPGPTISGAVAPAPGLTPPSGVSPTEEEAPSISGGNTPEIG